MKVAFITLGCKVNIYESDAIMALFQKKGAIIVSSEESFDSCIINTCSVTNQATAKCRKMIRNAIRNNPKAIIAVIGCYSQILKEEIAKIDGVDIILGNIDKASVVDLVYKKKKEQEMLIDVKNILSHHEFEELNPVNFSHTRAFLKIEDGCNNFCSYCIIPYTRGPIRSKKVENVINEINKIVSNGYNEVVLTGIHTGKYKDNNIDFTTLVKLILEKTKLKRLRISSIEINEITDEFIEMMKNSDVIAHHLHLPLQSGSDNVLKLMNRHYKREEFILRINYIKKMIPDISITTDIIVGFPQETDTDFNDTLDLANKVKFAKIHAFPFSKRKGTKACELKEVKDIVKTSRMKEILALDKKLQEEFYKSYVGTIQEIIIEDIHDGHFVGHSSNFLPIYLKFKENLVTKMVKVKINEYKDGKLYSELI